MKKESVGNDIKKTQSGQMEGLSSSDVHSEISATRRRFSRLGIGAAPIVISLVSKPVLGAQCLSNMLSGNLSDPNRGHCDLGTSPGGWGQPGGNINGFSDSAAWGMTGFTYGTKNSGHPTTYSGGSKTNQGVLASILKESQNPPVYLRELLNQSNGGSNRDRHILTAYLNALMSENLASPNFTYALSSAYVVSLANGTLPPGGVDLNCFLDSTWIISSKVCKP